MTVLKGVGTALQPMLKNMGSLMETNPAKMKERRKLVAGLMQKYLSIHAPKDGWSDAHAELFFEALEWQPAEWVVMAFKDVGTSWTFGFSPKPGDILAALETIRQANVQKFDPPGIPYFKPEPPRNDYEDLNENERARLEEKLRDFYDQQPDEPPKPIKSYALQAMGFTDAEIDEMK